MKLFTIWIFLMLGLISLSQAQNKAEALTMDSSLSHPKITFVSQKYDFGQVKKGEKVLTSFYFKNTGTRPLYILQVQTSCGCTVSEWTREAIAPNAVGEITVTFDSNAKESLLGDQEKALLVISNGINKEELLLMKGEVLKAE